MTGDGENRPVSAAGPEQQQTAADAEIHERRCSARRERLAARLRVN
jgi:hypothetical protein